MDPQRHCHHATVLVPYLKESTECVDVPKEVCAKTITNPRQVKKPFVRKWCYGNTTQSTSTYPTTTFTSPTPPTTTCDPYLKSLIGESCT